MAGGDEADLVGAAVERVEDRHELHARQAEHDLDTLPDELLHQRGAARARRPVRGSAHACGSVPAIVTLCSRRGPDASGTTRCARLRLSQRTRSPAAQRWRHEISGRLDQANSRSSSGRLSGFGPAVEAHRVVGVDHERPPARDRVPRRHGVAVLDVDRAQAGVGGPLGAAVDGPHALEGGPEPRRQVLERPVLVGEHRVPATVGQHPGHQHRDRRRSCQVRLVLVPVHGDAVISADDLQHLRVPGERRHVRVHADRAQAPGERDLVRRRQLLAGEHDDVVLVEQRPEPRGRPGVEVADVEPRDADPDRP